MTPENFTWQYFQHAILLQESPEAVFKKIATPLGMTTWFIGSSTYTSAEGNKRLPDELVQEGDRYHWKWLGKDFESAGSVLEIEENKFINLTFGAAWEVTFIISTVGERVQLRLAQRYRKGSDHNEFAHLNCCVCWVFFLTNLKSVMEHGIDLREASVENEVLVNQ